MLLLGVLDKKKKNVGNSFNSATQKTRNGAFFRNNLEKLAC